MTVQFKTVRTGMAKMKQGEMRKVCRTALVSLGEFWHKTLFPKRFTASGNNIYKFKERDPKYIASSKKRYPDWRPLVRSTRLAIATQTRYNVKASTLNGIERVIISMSRGHPTGTNPSITDELTQVTKLEMADMMRVYKENLIQLLAQNKTTKAAA